MRILTHSAHSGYEFELSKTGHEFVAMQGFWDDYRRPRPVNWHLVDRPEGKFDLGLVLAGDGFEKISPHPVPLVCCTLGDDGEGTVNPVVEERVHSMVFLSREVAGRWAMRDASKKRIIELGVDSNVFVGYVGDGENVLTVGWSIPSRWEKGLTQLNAINSRVKVTLVGKDNEALGYSAGTMPFERLLEAYRRHKVYLNPGCIIGISVAEAMMTGMPVVAFRPINLCDLIVDGENGFIVDTVHGAVNRIRELLDNPERRAKVGAAARKTAIERFSLPVFTGYWNRLFEEAVKPQ